MLRRRLPGNHGGDDSGLTDHDLRRVLRHGDRRLERIAIGRHDLSIRVRVECTGARVERVAIGSGDLEPAAAVQCEIETVARRGQRALDVQLANGGGAHAEADLRAFWNGRVASPVRHALHSLGFVEQIGELRTRALVAGRVDVRDVVSDRFYVRLLGVHARGRNGERSHALLLRSPSGRIPGTHSPPCRAWSSRPEGCAPHS